jgi:hypothetical protein
MRALAYSSLVICVLFLWGCDKDSSKSDSSLVGKWLLVKQQAGMSVESEPSSVETLEFTSSTYKHYIDGTLVGSGPYQIIQDESVEEEVCLVLPDDQYGKRIQFDLTEARKYFFEVKDNSLNIVSGCFAYDAGVFSNYTRCSTCNH